MNRLRVTSNSRDAALRVQQRAWQASLTPVAPVPAPEPAVAEATDGE
jgi:hypothetical protein